MTSPAQPWSVVTSVMYPLCGYVGYEAVGRTPEGAVFAVAMLLLCLGTGWRHWSPSAQSSKADQITMHFVFAGMVAYALGADWLVMSVAAVAAGWALEKWLNVDLRMIFGVYTAALLIAVIANYGLIYAAGPTVLMGTGLVFRDKVGGDEAHGAWHALTAIGIVLLFVGLRTGTETLQSGSLV